MILRAQKILTRWDTEILKSKEHTTRATSMKEWSTLRRSSRDAVAPTYLPNKTGRDNEVRATNR